MKNPRDYLAEIDENLRKIQAQGQVTPTENALFGMIDGLAGLQRTLLERVTLLEERVGVQPVAQAAAETADATFPSPAERRSAARRGRRAGDEPTDASPSSQTAARGPDTRNATINPDGAGTAPIPVEAARSRRGAAKARPDQPVAPGKARSRRS